MIAAQLLAYYFTELKDDQVKKVSPAGAALATALRSRIRSPPPASSPNLSQAASGWTTAGATGLALGFTRALSACERVCALSRRLAEDPPPA